MGPPPPGVALSDAAIRVVVEQVKNKAKPGIQRGKEKVEKVITDILVGLVTGSSSNRQEMWTSEE